jgi:cbb3-type cytochrome oxidase subunit 3
MFRILVFLLFTTFLHFANAQQLILKDVNQDSYPELKVVMMDRNPEASSDNNIQLSENGNIISASEYEVQLENKDKEFTQLAFILFENSFWQEYYPQREYFKLLLKKSLNSFSEKDELYFSEFDWTNKDGHAVIEDQITKGDKDAIISRLDKVQSLVRNGRKHRFSEVNTALIDALELLDKVIVDSTTTKSIFIFSGEVSNIHNPQFSQGDVILSSKQKNIPIYSVRFPRMSDKYTLKKVCDETYGVHLRAKVPDWEATVGELEEVIRGVSLLASGTTFTLNYSTSIAPGGQAVSLEFFNENSKNTETVVFNTLSYLEWVVVEPIRLVLFLLFVLILIGVVAYSYKKYKAKRIEEALRNKKQLDQLEEENETIREENEKALEVQQEGFQALSKEKEAQQQQQLVELEAQRLEEESQKRFLSRNRSSTLINNLGNSIVISNRVFYIGRKDSNDLMIDKSIVSKEHAAILFEKKNINAKPQVNGLFYISDLRSSNGTYVNNKKIAGTVELRDGDMITIGDISMTFRS